MTQMKQIITTLLILTLVPPGAAGNGDFLEETRITSPLKETDQQSAGHKLQNAIHNIYELYKESIVFISTEKTVPVKQKDSMTFDPFFRDYGDGGDQVKTKKQRGLGTGFIISSDGYICTNHHVVARAERLTVKVGDSLYPARVIGTDQLTDIALLKVETGRKLKPVYFGDSEKVRIGDFVVAIGNPFGLDKTYTFGIVSAIGRRNVDSTGNSHIQTDASINAGNSGGPLINMDGEVVGVNRIIYSGSGGSIGIGFAIAINTVKSTLIILKNQRAGKRGYIGVSGVSVTDDQAKAMDLKRRHGVAVRSLAVNGPAAAAGIKVNDVILKVNGREIPGFQELQEVIGNLETGRSATLTIWRSGKIVDLRVVVSDQPR